MLHARKLCLAVLSIAALAAAGCGGDDSGGGGGGGGGGDDESQIRDVVTSYAKAVADRDGDQACGYLTDAARKQLEAVGPAIGANGCPDIMVKVTESASDKEREQLGDLKVTSVEVDGDHATVEVEAAGRKGDPSTLIKQDGTWKIEPTSGGGTATAATAATVTTP